MYCIALISMDGHVDTCLGHSKSDCHKRAEAFKALPGRYIVSTIPYSLRLTQSNVSKLRVQWDTEIPDDIKKSFGMELRVLMAVAKELQQEQKR